MKDGRTDRRRYAACLLATLLAATGVARAQGAVEVTTLPRDGSLLVSLELSGGYTEETRVAVESGLEAIFRFDVELREAVAFWPDRTVDRAYVTASVRYDGLTGRYRVERAINGRVQQSRVVEEVAVVRQLVTSLERLPLFSTAMLETNGDYHVRVRVDTQPRTAWFRWPWDRAAALGRASFTFLP